MDERVAMAISHWSPRFTTNGVTAGDFERITGRLERWADWCGAWSAVAAEHEQLGRSDAAVILMRKIWQRELSALKEGKSLKQWRRTARLAATSGV